MLPTAAEIQMMTPAQLKMNFQRNMLGRLGYLDEAEIMAGYMTTTLRDEFNQRYAALYENKIRADWEGQLAQMVAIMKIFKETNHFQTLRDDYKLPGEREIN